MTRHRIGIVGLGMAARKHALALAELRERAEVAWCWSPSVDRRTAFAATHGLPACETVDRIMDDPTIDLVLVLTPPWTHLDLVRRCAEAGKHVLLEKPIEATLERSEDVVRICAEAGVRLGVVFQNRCRTPHVRLKELVRDGTLGHFVSIGLAMRWWRADSYFEEPGRGMKDRDGGGVLLTQAIHIMDQLMDIAGEPEEAFAFAANSGLRAIDTEDVVSGVLRWKTGTLGTIDATTARFPTTGEQIDIAAEHGSALLERTRLRVWLKSGETIDVSEDASDPRVQGDYLAHRRLIEDMLDAIEQGRPPLANGDESLKVHRLIATLLQPARTSAPIMASLASLR